MGHNFGIPSTTWVYGAIELGCLSASARSEPHAGGSVEREGGRSICPSVQALEPPHAEIATGFDADWAVGREGGSGAQTVGCPCIGQRG